MNGNRSGFILLDFMCLELCFCGTFYELPQELFGVGRGVLPGDFAWINVADFTRKQEWINAP